MMYLMKVTQYTMALQSRDQLVNKTNINKRLIEIIVLKVN